MQKPTLTVKIHRPSNSEFLFFILSGAIVSVPLTLFVEQYVSPLLTGLSTFSIALISVAVFAPFIEEFSKIFPLFYRHGETQRSIFDLGLCVGLGFGIVEFITYVAVFGPAIIIARIPGLFFHPASTSMAAYGIATRRPLPFYLAAVFLHFLNNFLAILAPGVFPFSVFVLVIALYVSWILYDKTKEEFVQPDEMICTINKPQQA
jgi:RsiW-degrading membrane proteinase PrsW (M82 family)